MSDESWPEREEVAQIAAALPPLVRFGTSTWNYPGWTGLIYEKQYPATGATAKMLGEYAKWPLFGTVGIDAFFYRPPTPKTLQSYAAALPEGFRCVSKVWERITAHSHTNPRTHSSTGEANADWLNVDLFVNEVLGPLLEHFTPHLGPQVFEFQTIPRSAKMSPSAFAARLDTFFSRLPTEGQYAVEIRNEEFLIPEYFAVLRNHGVGHVFNSWTRMPGISEQLLMHDSVTANFIVSRALLRPGRQYAQAVEAFAPYNRIQDPNPELRGGIVALAHEAVARRIPAYLLINNRAEGSAPLTITAVARALTA